MTFLAELTSRVVAVRTCAALDVEPGELLPAVRALDDEAVVGLLSGAQELVAWAERLKVVTAAVIAERSGSPQGGLSGARGHRSPVQLVQEITGGTRADAFRTLRVGRGLLDEEAPGADAGSAGRGGPAEDRAPDGAVGEPVPPRAWDEPVRCAMLEGRISVPQHDAIRRGLGRPTGEADAARVWAVAAEQLIDEARGLPVEELGRRARAMRDRLDPIGARERYERQYEARSWRMWTDEDGARHARIDFDHEMGAWVEAIRDAALRPRRGGPRFLTDEQRAEAALLERDSRTNDQLAYDLMTDLLRAGALARSEDVFGARQPGVRMVVFKDAVGRRDAFGRLLGIGHIEDGGEAVPGPVLDRSLCDAGAVEVTVDSCGNPLDVGREQRLFTAKQRIALAVRDGGCIWPGCDRPPSYCEAHHIDGWAGGGRTDTERGVLLCRFHHLLLHNQGWRITRPGLGAFRLLPPGARERDEGDPIVLRSRSPLRWAFDPPPDRAGWRAA